MKKRQVKFLEGEHGGQRSEEYLRDRGIYPAAMWCPKEDCPWGGEVTARCLWRLTLSTVTLTFEEGSCGQ